MFGGKRRARYLRVRESVLKNVTRMENDIPKIDLPQDWVIGKLTEKDLGLLNLYANYPCRLKAGIFALVLSGRVDASINLTRSEVEPCSFITLLPGSIFQIHRIEGDLSVYFMGFSSDFINQAHVGKAFMEMHYMVKDSPVFALHERAASLLIDYFELLIKIYATDASGLGLGRTFINHLFAGIFLGVSAMYKAQTEEKAPLTKAEQISQNFAQLVTRNYMRERNVAWYAKQLGITQAHLSTIVRQTTGRTCVEIITSMVIMDAKAQLKSTDLSIHDIAYSLNFTNMSFFGKYFKRYVGMGPLEYRKS